MHSFLVWLNDVCADADPVKAGFQAKGLYLLLCVTGPVAFGSFVAATIAGIEKAFGIKLSSKGGGH